MRLFLWEAGGLVLPRAGPGPVDGESLQRTWITEYQHRSNSPCCSADSSAMAMLEGLTRIWGTPSACGSTGPHSVLSGELAEQKKGRRVPLFLSRCGCHSNRGLLKTPECSSVTHSPLITLVAGCRIRCAYKFSSREMSQRSLLLELVRFQASRTGSQVLLPSPGFPSDQCHSSPGAH